MKNIRNTIDSIMNHTTSFVRDFKVDNSFGKKDVVIKIPISKIIRDEEPFKSLNPVDNAQRERLKDSIHKNGFMKSNPILVWRTKRNGKWDYILIDGYSRCAVLEAMGITEAWAIIHEYANLEDAVTAARYQEYSRRHDDAKSLYQQFEKLNLVELKNQPGRLNEIVAKQLGISAHNAHKLLQINAKASDDVKTALREGTISTASAFQSVSNEKKYSPKDKAFMEGVNFCLQHLKNKKSSEEILKLANESLDMEEKK